MTLRLALLSTADINEKLVAGAREAENVEVVAIGSRDPTRARRQAGELNVPRALGSYEEVLADPGVDAVYIPLPNSLHVEWSVRALEAGKHVLCEKPLSRHPEEVERAFDAAERNDRVLAEAFMWRHHPQAAAAPRADAPRWARCGSCAAPSRSRCRWRRTCAGTRRSTAARSWTWVATACRARASCSASPQRSPPRRWAGTWTRAWSATMALRRRRARALRLRLRSRRSATSSRWWARRARSSSTTPGTRARPVIEVRSADGTVSTVEVEEADPYGCELEDFARACAREIEHPFGRADAVGQARTIAALYEAADSGRAVAL